MKLRDGESSAPPSLLYRFSVPYSLVTSSLRSTASINGLSHLVVLTVNAKENEAKNSKNLVLGKHISS